MLVLWIQNAAMAMVKQRTDHSSDTTGSERKQAVIVKSMCSPKRRTWYRYDS
jgi:hypothetical protein